MLYYLSILLIHLSLAGRFPFWSICSRLRHIYLCCIFSFCLLAVLFMTTLYVRTFQHAIFVSCFVPLVAFRTSTFLSAFSSSFHFFIFWMICHSWHHVFSFSDPCFCSFFLFLSVNSCEITFFRFFLQTFMNCGVA